MTDRLLHVHVYRDERPIMAMVLPSGLNFVLRTELDADGQVRVTTNLGPDTIIVANEQKLAVSMWTEEHG